MKPQLRYEITCSCGQTELVGAMQAGILLPCAKCGAKLTAPSLREIKHAIAVDISPIGQLERRIIERQGPFDGNCQMCNVGRGAVAMHVEVIAFSDSSEFARAFTVPCVLCDICASEFRKGVWTGRLQGVVEACVKAVWLCIAIVLALIVALIMPLVGIVTVLGFASSLLVYLTRNRGNPYVKRHLNRICKLDEILVDGDGYVARAGAWDRLSI